MDKDPFTQHPNVPLEQMPNVFWYWASTMKTLFERMTTLVLRLTLQELPDEMFEYIVSKDDEVEKRILRNIHQYDISIVIAPMLRPSNNPNHVKWISVCTNRF